MKLEVEYWFSEEQKRWHATAKRGGWAYGASLGPLAKEKFDVFKSFAQEIFDRAYKERGKKWKLSH